MLQLLVDFVPNHMAVDHPWTKERPELIMQGSENSLNREPQNFFKVVSALCITRARCDCVLAQRAR
eukprot:3271970-Rhodomonas_salina.1